MISSLGHIFEIWSDQTLSDAGHRLGNEVIKSFSIRYLRSLY